MGVLCDLILIRPQNIWDLINYLSVVIMIRSKNMWNLINESYVGLILIRSKNVGYLSRCELIRSKNKCEPMNYLYVVILRSKNMWNIYYGVS